MSARGSDFRFYLREQTDFVTPAPLGVTGKWWSLPLLSWNPQPQLQRQQDGVIPAGLPTAQPGQLIDGLSSFRWSARVPAGRQTFGFWLRQMFGAGTTSGTAPNYVHFFRSEDVPSIPSFSVQGYYSTPGVNRRFIAHGCFVNTMRIDASRVADRVAFDLDGFGIAHAKTGTLADDDPILISDAEDAAPQQLIGAFFYDAGSGDVPLNGILTGFSATVSNGVELDEAVFNGTSQPSLRTAPRWSAEGTLTVRCVDYTLFDLAQSGAKIDIEIRWVSGTNNRLNLRFNGVKLDPHAWPVPNDGVLEATIRFVADKVDTGYSIFYRLDSQQASYAPVP